MASNDLRDILNRPGAVNDGAGQQTAEAPEPQAVASDTAQTEVREGHYSPPTNERFTPGDVVRAVAAVEVECVCGGCYQRIHFGPQTDPSRVAAMLRELDPQAQIRDAFPQRGGSGNRETKQARVLVITARVTDSGAFIDLTATTGQEDVTIAVSKRNSSTFLDTVKGLGKLSEANISKLAKAFESKTTATIVLPDPERIGAKFWTADDGRHFMDSLTADAPELSGDAGQTEENGNA